MIYTHVLNRSGGRGVRSPVDSLGFGKQEGQCLENSSLGKIQDLSPAEDPDDHRSR
jgi:hypothetical protein